MNDLKEISEQFERLRLEVGHVVVGQEKILDRLLIALVCRGHVLLEGVPGIAKTTLVRTLATAIGAEFHRISFTPDLLPADVTGTQIFNQKDGSFSAKKGPVFTNLLLADEINRASPKTQSAMLETMQERAVTLMGVTRPLPDPFFVLASQNPIELEGTYPLPEAQTDRFLFKLPVDAPDADTLAAIITSRAHGTLPKPDFTLSRETLQRAFDTVARVVLPDAVAKWIGRLVAATHGREYVTYGASPRAAIALAEASRAVALLDGRPSVGFDDVRAVAFPVLNHRLLLDYRAKLDGVSAQKIIDDVLASVPVAV